MGVDIDGQARFGTRVSGAMMLAGASLGAISVLLPPRAGNSDAIILVLVAIAAVFGVVLVRSRQALPEWLFGLAIATGTALVTYATYEGGLATGTEDNEMLYVWICLLAFNFLSFRHAVLQLALVGVAYGVLLTAEPSGQSVTRWLISMTTLAVAGLLVHRLRASRDRLVSELTERATRDDLTGLLNRGALEERAALELARARRDGTPVSLIVLDIDGFKAFNDGLGHPAGDQLLRAVADGLRLQTRQVDAMARLGGDEFGVLLPGAAIGDAVLVAERLREAARIEGGAWATLSLGVAEGDGSGDFEHLWHEADAAMYEAKRAGGDAVCSAPAAAEEPSARRATG